MHQDLFKEEDSPQLSPIDFSDELPQGLTREAYIKMHREVWATIRHDFYQDLLRAARSKEGKVTEEQFQALYEKNLDGFEQIRAETFERVLNCKLARP